MLSGVADRAWARRLATRPLRRRIRLLPASAGVALLGISILSLGFGLLNPRSLSRTRSDDYPALEEARDRRETVVALQTSLRNAVITRDSGRLADADSLRDVFHRSAQQTLERNSCRCGDAGVAAIVRRVLPGRPQREPRDDIGYR
jgi:hypothetical protein